MARAIRRPGYSHYHLRLHLDLVRRRVQELRQVAAATTVTSS
jgi:hypothetical protein